MKNSTIALLVGAGFAAVYFFVTSGTPSAAKPSASGSTNVTMEDGKQVVLISAKGGYDPRTSVVKPGVPTVLRFETDGTFDCTSMIRIPSLKVNQTLPATGTTDVPVGEIAAGTPLTGTCGMGMYRFEVEAKS